MATVAIIEDEDDLRTMLEMQLEFAGHTVAFSTGDAIGVMWPERWEPVTHAFIDVMLGPESGHTLARWLIQYASHVKRIACTALDPRLMFESTKLYDRVITKPYTPDDVEEALV